MAGATTAYKGRKSIVKANDPGIAEEKLLVRCSFIEENLHSPATVYFVHKLELFISIRGRDKNRDTYSETKAALPRTVSRTAK